MTIADLRAEARRRLASGDSRLDPREATLLLARVLDTDEARLLAHPERSIAPTSARRFRQLLDRRLNGEPFAYLIGEREFFGRSFLVDARVLIPRPETEHLVEVALELTAEAPLVLDLATGCGCVGLTLALEKVGARVVASDVSLDALTVASSNRARFELERRVDLVASDLFAALSLEPFDVIVCNPPYVDRAVRSQLQIEVREHEPPLALFADEWGLAVYRRLLKEALDGPVDVRLCLEIGAGQLPALRALAAPHWLVENVKADLAGIPRVVVLARRDR